MSVHAGRGTERGVFRSRRDLGSGGVLVGGLALVVLFVAGLFVLMGTSSYDVWGGLVVGPVLFAISIPILARQATREGDPRLFWLLALALALKLGAAILAHYVAYTVYHGAADVVQYHNQGVHLAQQFRSGNFNVGTATGTNFPVLLNGILYAIIGPTVYGGFLFHSWLAFWGLFLCYRAFTIAVPEGRARTYGRLLFFLPSEIFWSALMGKEPWMVFALGIATYGVARALSGRARRGLPLIALGLWFMALVRPHVAAMVAIAAVIGYVFKRAPAGLRELGPVVKALGIVVFMVLALVFASQAQRFLHESGVDTSKGLTRALQEASLGGAYGGSMFQPAIASSPGKFPLAAFTVLFRPLPIETGSATLEVLAALEGTFLLALALFRVGWVLAAIRSSRRQPFVAFALTYTALFIVGFSSLANFGLLARERVQLTPLFLVLLSVPPRDWGRRSVHRSASHTSRLST